MKKYTKETFVGGDLLGDGEIITDTQSPTDIMDLVSKYAFGDVGDDKQ